MFLRPFLSVRCTKIFHWFLRTSTWWSVSFIRAVFPVPVLMMGCFAWRLCFFNGFIVFSEFSFIFFFTDFCVFSTLWVHTCLSVICTRSIRVPWRRDVRSRSAYLRLHVWPRISFFSRLPFVFLGSAMLLRCFPGPVPLFAGLSSVILPQ